jgi:hypothetical protein
MELLIPGLALVALMVYISTRIKRSAARAFEAEHIDCDGFTLEKPDGFLHRIDDEGGFAFDAYSKDFGMGAAENVRAATAVVIANEAGLERAAQNERKRLASAETGEKLELGEAHGLLIKGSLVKDGHEFEAWIKILQRGSRTLVLRIEVLKERAADFVERVQTMLISFAAS